MKIRIIISIIKRKREKLWGQSLSFILSLTKILYNRIANILGADAGIYYQEDEPMESLLLGATNEDGLNTDGPDNVPTVSS